MAKLNNRSNTGLRKYSDAKRRRMMMDARARKVARMICRYYTDGVIDSLRDKISALIAKISSKIKNPKLKKALLNAASAIAAGKGQKASIILEKASLAVKNNPAIVGSAAAAAAVAGGLAAAWKLSEKFVLMVAKAGASLHEAKEKVAEKAKEYGGKVGELAGKAGGLASSLGGKVKSVFAAKDPHPRLRQ